MHVTVRLHGFGERERAADVPDGATYLDLLRALDIPSESVVVFCDERPVPTSDVLEPRRAIRVVRVISGGAPRPR